MGEDDGLDQEIEAKVVRIDKRYIRLSELGKALGGKKGISVWDNLRCLLIIELGSRVCSLGEKLEL